MTETEGGNPFTAQAFVERYLENELSSDDPGRVKRASLAKEANKNYGIGNWYWGGELGMSAVLRRVPVGWNIIALGPKIR